MNQPFLSSAEPMRAVGGAALVAWLLAGVYYFYQYALRSAPSVMVP